MTAIFEVLSLTVFSRSFIQSEKKIEFVYLVHRRYPGKHFSIDNFERGKIHVCLLL